jgi:hypothetical protein
MPLAATLYGEAVALDADVDGDAVIRESLP